MIVNACVCGVDFPDLSKLYKIRDDEGDYFMLSCRCDKRYKYTTLDNGDIGWTEAGSEDE